MTARTRPAPAIRRTPTTSTGRWSGRLARQAASLAERTRQLSLAPAAYAGTFENDEWGTIVVEDDPLADINGGGPALDP